VDATVITELGLVGKVVSVTPHSAKVLLITDPDSAVGGRVQRSRDVGIVEGSIEQANMVQMVNIPREADIKEGDLIISSGLGGVFPAGLIIGKVENIKDEEYSFFRRASIKPAVNFNRLEEVLVIKQHPNVDYSTENRGL
jgi:rod shape-determining protein MreC